MRPGRQHTYKYETQASYYGQYARSLYAITAPRAGLDCLRHYEILASGAVPFFVESEALSNAPLSMYAFPRSLVREATCLRGVPSEAAVAHALRTDGELRVNRSAFDMDAYCALRAKLLSHTEAHLTTLTLARYVLEQLRLARPYALGAPPLPPATTAYHVRRVATAAGASPLSSAASSSAAASALLPRVLFVSSKGVSGDTWQHAFLYHGLVRLLGKRLSSLFGRKEVLYHDFVYPHRFCCYGRGYSYARTLPTPPVYSHCRKEYADALLRDQLRKRLDAGYFNVVIVTAQSNRCCALGKCYGADLPPLLNAYLRRFGNRTAVATVDGSDGFGGCGGATFAAELERVDVHFLREVDARFNGRTAHEVRAPETRELPALITQSGALRARTL